MNSQSICPISVNSQQIISQVLDTIESILVMTHCMNDSMIVSKKRILFIDQIKAIMIALVIAIHVPFAFGDGGWIGARVLVDGPVPVFRFSIGLFGYLCQSTFMYMLFLLSGYFVPRSVHKKGIRSYLKSRALRLGLPFLAGLLLINNGAVLVGTQSPNSPFADLALGALPFNRIGVLWFLIVLFAFDLLYCGWTAFRGDRYSIDASVPLPQLRSWLMSAFVLGVLEVLMATRIDLWSSLARSPLDGLGAQGMHIFTYAFLFFLGCKASFHKWIERLDSHLVVKWSRFSVALFIALATTSLGLFVHGSLATEYAKLMLVGSFCYPFVAWGFISYLLLWFQRNPNYFGQWLATAGVDSYGAYVIHTLVLSLVISVISSAGLNHWLVFLAVASLTILISFVASHQLRRIPALAKVI